MRPEVRTFFDEPTNTASHVVSDPATGHCAIIDSVMGFDAPSGRTDSSPADAIIAYVKEKGLTIDWILETHVHADHLSGAPYLKEQLGGQIGIGSHINDVQSVFKTVFNAEPSFSTDGRQFDHLFADEERGDVVLEAWIPDADPTRFLQTNVVIPPGDGDEASGTLTLGPLEFSAIFDATGAMLSGRTLIGQTEMVLERVWVAGALP